MTNRKQSMSSLAFPATHPTILHLNVAVEGGGGDLRLDTVLMTSSSVVCSNP